MEVKTSIRRGGNRMNNDLKHHGVKGMKWGVRRYQPYPKGKRNAGKFLDSAKQTGSKVTKDSSIKDNAKALISSKTREMSMVRAQKEIKNLSTSDAKKVVTRAQLENRLKTLNSTKNVGDGQSNKDYLNRANMSNDELKRKVNRLQLSANMRTEAKSANKELVDLGKKAAGYLAPFAVQYAVKQVISSGKNFGPGEDGGASLIVNDENMAKIRKSAVAFVNDLI